MFPARIFQHQTLELVSLDIRAAEKRHEELTVMSRYRKSCCALHQHDSVISDGYQTLEISSDSDSLSKNVQNSSITWKPEPVVKQHLMVKSSFTSR